MMNRIKQLFLVIALAIFIMPFAATGQTNSANLSDSAVKKADNKEKFSLSLEMMKEYYDALESRVEKTIVLLIGVVGWLITSETARKSLATQPNLYKGAIITLTLFIIVYGFNMYHFLEKYRQIEEVIRNTNYVEPEYFSRYQMPKGVFLFYMLPIIIFYFFIVGMLWQIKNKNSDLSDPSDSEKEK